MALAILLPVVSWTLPQARAPRPPPPRVTPCPDDAAPETSLYCMELVPTPDLIGATGVVELHLPASPFGLSVGPDGHHHFDLVLDLEGLPAPETLGPYTVFVAWVTTPELDPFQKLGVVSNGRWPVGRVAFSKFLIMITAEPSPTIETRSKAGRLVMRGTSPSGRMLPHDQSLGVRASHGESHEPRPGNPWPTPPMHPGVPVMIPGLSALRPAAEPFLPGAGVDPASLPLAEPRRAVPLQDGDTLVLRAGLVRRTIRGKTLVMYGFNAQYPGPLIVVRQGATVVVDFENGLDQPSSVHWHGIRLDNASDGVPGVTQDAVPPGGRFRYRVTFPDAGIYWYHPHVREDVQQDLGLYGNMMVRPSTSGWLSPVNREEFLILDDLLVDDTGSLIPFGRETATHALMGRFGNVHLVNGEPAYDLAVAPGEVVRFYLTNVSNTRTYHLTVPGARLKLVGSDVGKYEQERWVDGVVLAPAERYILDARFGAPGRVALVNRVQAIDHPAGGFFAEADTLGFISVEGAPARPDLAGSFERLARHHDVVRDIDRYRGLFERPPDRELILTLEVDGLPFALEQVMRLDTAYANPVEWSGTMPAMDLLSTGREVTWILRDPATGRENMDIDWRFAVGDVVKIRLVNDHHVLHPMQHPIHLHGQRFLILARNGVAAANLVWKDTVLLPAGTTTDILLEVSNPGRWMLHCHIAEHLETGMHMVFTVTGS